VSTDEFLAQILSSFAFGFVAIFFLKKYVSDTDKDLENIESKINRISDKLSNQSRELTQVNIDLHEKLEDFRKHKVEVSTEFLKEVTRVHQEINSLRMEFFDTLKEMKSTDKNVVKHFGKLIHIMRDYQETKGKIKIIEEEIIKIGEVIYKRDK
jgi:chromosome segregation ATPase